MGKEWKEQIKRQDEALLSCLEKLEEGDKILLILWSPEAVISWSYIIFERLYYDGYITPEGKILTELSSEQLEDESIQDRYVVRYRLYGKEKSCEKDVRYVRGIIRGWR